MIRTFSLTALATLALATSAHAETRDYPVGAFTEIDVSAGIDVNFTTGAAHAVTVTNEKGDFSDIEVLVRGDTLVLKRKKNSWGWGRRAPYQVEVSAESISAIEASSGADIAGSGVRGGIVKIDVSSGADADITDIVADTVRLESSSGSDIYVSGSCDRVTAESSSGSDIEAEDLICKRGSADASSGSDITLHTSERLTADASSGADITAYGNPTDVDSDKSSGGSVRIRG